MLVNLKRFKYLLKSSTSIESIAKKIDTSSRNVEHFIKLYNFKTLPKKEKLLPDGENREDYITKRGSTFKKEHIRTEKSGYRVRTYSNESGERKTKLEHREVVEKNIGRTLTKKRNCSPYKW